jgi:ribosomal protein S26
MVNKRTCVVCGFDISGTYRKKYCITCAIAVERVMTNEQNKLREKQKNEFWKQLSSTEKDRRIAIAREYYFEQAKLKENQDGRKR